MNKLIKTKGFTLIEMMVVVAIVGILAAIAYPLYTKYVENGRVTEGKSLLMNNAQFMQSWYLDKGTYAAAPTTSFPSSKENSQYYTFGFSGTPDATTFSIKATPTNKHTTTDYLIVDQDNNLKSCTSVATPVCTKL